MRLSEDEKIVTLLKKGDIIPDSVQSVLEDIADKEPDFQLVP